MVANDNRVAKTILEQLGGRKFMAMTGANTLRFTENSLSMKFPSAKEKINYLKITLNAGDFYDMEFGKIVKFNYKIVKTYNNVYFDQLQSIFTGVTGLALCERETPHSLEVG